MKKTVIVFGAIALFTLSWASLFKTLHWPGGNILLLLSLGLLVPATSVLAAIYLNHKK